MLGRRAVMGGSGWEAVMPTTQPRQDAGAVGARAHPISFEARAVGAAAAHRGGHAMAEGEGSPALRRSAPHTAGSRAAAEAGEGAAGPSGDARPLRAGAAARPRHHRGAGPHRRARVSARPALHARHQRARAHRGRPCLRPGALAPRRQRARRRRPGLSLATLSCRRADGNLAVPPETLWLLAAALTPVLIARRVLQHTVVTLQTIMGSVAAYLQIAVAYAFLFQTIDAFTPSPFFGEEVSTTTYMYFSLVTISTVGYGDFAAVTTSAGWPPRARPSSGRSSSSRSSPSSWRASRPVCRVPRRACGGGRAGRGASPPHTLLQALSPHQAQSRPRRRTRTQGPTPP